MNRRIQVNVLLTLVTVAAAATAAPPPPRAAAPSVGALRPDISVKAVWIGKGPVSQGFEPLGHDPALDEPVSLVCDIGISGAVAREAFKIAFYIDGVKTCGEGEDTIQNPPVCEFTWPLAVGTKVFVSWVPHQAGTHVYRCGADIGNQVSERDETNNSRQVSFTVRFPPATGHIPVLKPVTVRRFPLGPRLGGQ